MAKKAFDIHDIFARNLAFENEILWDLYTSHQFDIFKLKLNELFPDPEAVELDKNKAMEKIRETVYSSTVSQTKYTNKNLLATFILITVAKGTTYLEARDAKQFSVHLIVRTRKCIKKDDTTGCCMIFIDEHGRVYQNWEDFMSNNLLPEGVALAPNKGVYSFENDTLIIDSWQTPAGSMISKVVGATDIAAGVGGFAAAGVTVSALALPVAAPVLAGAAIVCAGTGIYSAIRSGWQLWSRKKHEQSIALTDRTARGCWLGVATGANTEKVEKALVGREVSLIQETVVNGMNISTMLLSGTGVANGVFDLILKYSDDEEVTGLDYLQLADSLVIFTHSVYNFRLASAIVSKTQTAKMSSFRTELRNRQRQIFDKITKESKRTQGVAKDKMDVIRLINEVPDNQYLIDLDKIHKTLNRNRVRFRPGKDGFVILDDLVAVKPDENILRKLHNPIPQCHQTIPNQEAVNSLTNNAFSENSETLYSYCQTAFQVGVFILHQDSFQNCVRYLIEKVGEDITTFLIKKAKEFLERFREKVEKFIKTTLYLETVLWDLYKKCEQNIVNMAIDIIEKEIPELYKGLLDYYEEMSCTNGSAKKVLCDICKGYYEICVPMSADPL